MISREEREVIFNYFYNDRMSISDISRRLNRPRNTLRAILDRPIDHRYERRPLLTERDERRIVNAARRSNTNARIIREQNDLQCHPQTVRRVLHKNSMKYQRLKKSRSLISRHRQDRMRYATEHRNWTRQQWNRVFFSDEKKFNLNGPDGCRYAWMEEGRRRERDVCNKRDSIMVWAAFSSQIRSDIVFITQRLDSSGYCTILEGHLLPLLARGMQFQQDNAPIHTSRYTIQLIFCGKIGSDYELARNVPRFKPYRKLMGVDGN